MVEVVGLAEELRQVGRDRIDEVLHFGRTTLAHQVGAVVAEGRDSKCAQAAREAAIDQIALALGQDDPGMLVRELREGFEVLVGERELAVRIGNGEADETSRRCYLLSWRRHSDTRFDPRTLSNPGRPERRSQAPTASGQPVRHRRLLRAWAQAWSQ